VRLAFDVVVVGGGPAGAVAARQLAQNGAGVLLVEASRYDRYRIGEVMDAYGRYLLCQLGMEHVLESVKAVQCDGVVSAWGTDDLAVRPAIKNQHGAAMILNRRRFDAALANEAARAGATVWLGTVATSVRPTREGFLLELASGTKRTGVSCERLVDATGRRATFVRRLGGTQRIRDRMVGLGRRLSASDDEKDAFQSVLLLESVTQGYWYSVPVGRRKVMAVLMTDGDLAKIARPWRTALVSSAHTLSRLEATGKRSKLDRWDARSLISREPAKLLVVAAGDAAMACDPLAADGIVRAIRSGQAAAVAVMAGADAIHELGAQRQRAFTEYEAERANTYAIERRYGQLPFWARRLPPSPPVPITIDPLALVRAVEATAASRARAEALIDPSAVRAILRSAGAEGRTAVDVLARARAASPGLTPDEKWVSALELLVRGGALSTDS